MQHDNTNTTSELASSIDLRLSETCDDFMTFYNMPTKNHDVSRSLITHLEGLRQGHCTCVSESQWPKRWTQLSKRTSDDVGQNSRASDSFTRMALSFHPNLFVRWNLMPNTALHAQQRPTWLKDADDACRTPPATSQKQHTPCKIMGPTGTQKPNRCRLFCRHTPLCCHSSCL